MIPISPRLPLRLRLGLLALLLAVAAPPPALAEPAALEPGRYSSSQGPRYWLGRVELDYARQHPLHPPVAELTASSFALGVADDGYVGPRRGGRNAWFTLDELRHQEPVAVYASGLRELSEQLVALLNARGLVGVYVAPHPADIDPQTGRDLRPGGESRLRLLIHTGRVGDVRTFSTDPARGVEDRVNAPEHRVVSARSPLRPAGAAAPLAADDAAADDLLLRIEIDDYVASLNRHPLRHVDVVLTPTLEPGRAHVDYVVSEERPWSLYAQMTDTGTESSSSDWRQRMGFTHYQLTGHDDVLRIDSVTDGFDDLFGLFASYEGLIPGLLDVEALNRLRWRFGYTQTQYEGGDIGIFDNLFEGETRRYEFGFRHPVYQDGDLFVDAGVSLHHADLEVENLGIDGDLTYTAPEFLISAERWRPERAWSLRGSWTARLSGDDVDDFELAGGRADITDSWRVLRFGASYSFYVDYWLRTLRPVVARPPHVHDLEHELAFEVGGQYSVGTRLLPQEQGVLGGVYTVRGYPQSIVARDSMVHGRVEYRYHLPMRLSPRPAADLPLLGSFHIGPASHSRRPDWDLVLRTFFDYGHGWDEDAQAGEPDESLAALGIGAELRIRRNLSLSFDWGYALLEVANDRVEKGDTEAHLGATLRY